jgi:hypothetical protein
VANGALDKLDGRTPTEVVTGTTPDISQYALFDWYEPIRYHDSRHAFPNERKLLGRFLGVAESCAEEMSFHILMANGRITIRKLVWAITEAEKPGLQYETELALFDKAMEVRLETVLHLTQPSLTVSRIPTSLSLRMMMNQSKRLSQQC